MKPPHGNRSGGSSRPPSDRGPYRGSGHGSGSSDAGGRGDRPRHDGPPRHGTHGGKPGGKHGAQGGGPRGDFQPRAGREGGGGRGDFPPRPGREGGGGPRPSREGAGPRSDFQPRPGREGGGPRGEFQARPAREGSGPRFGGGARHEGPRHHAPEAPKGTVWLYGLHAVAAALANPARRLRRLLLTEEAEGALGKHIAPPWALSPERVDRGRLDHLLGRDVVHQGAALLADHLAPPSLQSVLERPGAIVVLDQVTDPRNVGAIMRSAAAFGAAALIVQDRNAPEETGALAKAASGALEIMPLLRAVNIARTIIALKAANVWCIGLDAGGKPLSGPAFADRRVALVLGAEGEGLRRLTRETCDEVAGLSMSGAMESLNVSAAAAIALYEIARR